eukprot:1936518-Rhodomonas_salina.1
MSQKSRPSSGCFCLWGCVWCAVCRVSSVWWCADVLMCVWLHVRALCASCYCEQQSQGTARVLSLTGASSPSSSSSCSQFSPSPLCAQTHEDASAQGQASAKTQTQTQTHTHMHTCTR